MCQCSSLLKENRFVVQKCVSNHNFPALCIFIIVQQVLMSFGTQSLVLCVCFVDRFVFFFFWPLCCLFFFDLRILVTPLVSSNFSFLHQCIFITVHKILQSFSILKAKTEENECGTPSQCTYFVCFPSQYRLLHYTVLGYSHCGGAMVKVNNKLTIWVNHNSI